MPIQRTSACSAFAYATASAALRRSGSETISSSGVPARLRSMPVMPWKSSCRLLPASSSRCARVSRTRISPRVGDAIGHLAALHDGDLVLRDLVALRQVRVEVVLAREHADAGGSSRRPRGRSGSRARRRRGSAPAARRAARCRPREACVFGGAPNAVDAPEKIFDAVESCACVSSPMTTSQSSWRGSLGGGTRACQSVACWKRCADGRAARASANAGPAAAGRSAGRRG